MSEPRIMRMEPNGPADVGMTESGRHTARGATTSLDDRTLAVVLGPVTVLPAAVTDRSSSAPRMDDEISFLPEQRLTTARNLAACAANRRRA